MNMTLVRYGRRIAAAIGAFCLCSTGHAAPQATADYFPAKVGDTWTMTTDADGKKITQTVTVTAVKKVKGATEATFDYKADGKGLNTEVYRITPNAVNRLSGGLNGSTKMKPPITIIKYPLKAGDTWKWEGDILTNGQTIKATSELMVFGPETVKTPAGTFQAMRVHSALVVEGGGQKVEMPNDYWFAKGVGMVKQHASFGKVEIDGMLTKYNVK